MKNNVIENVTLKCICNWKVCLHAPPSGRTQRAAGYPLKEYSHIFISRY